MTVKDLIDQWFVDIFWCDHCFSEKSNGGICRFHKVQRQNFQATIQEKELRHTS